MDEVTDHYLQNLKQEYDVDIHEDHGSHHEEAEGDDHSRDEITQHIGREGITQEIEQHIGREGSPQRIPMTLPEKLQDGEEHSDSGEEHYNDSQHGDREFSLDDKEGECLEDVSHDGDTHHQMESNKVYVVASLEEDGHDDHEIQMLMNKNSLEEQPKRHLFGPPSWKPEQLQLAIEAVKKGYSLTEAGKQYGIPRTTLSNKIYGRKRKRPKETTGTVSFTSPSTMNSLGSAHSLFIGYDYENLLAKMISNHLHVQRHILTRCVLDLVKYFANSQTYSKFKDDYILEWIGYFFIRHRQARFEISTAPNAKNEEEEKKYVEYVFRRHGQKEKADNIRKSLFTFIGETKLANGAKSDYVGMLWWYYFLKKYDSVKYFFINNLTWCDTILDDTLLFGEDRRPIKTALTNMILNRTKPKPDSYDVSHRPNLSNQNNLEQPRVSQSFTSVARPSPESTRPTQSSRPPEIRRQPELRSHTEYHPTTRSQDELSSSNDDLQDHYVDHSAESPNITSSTTTISNRKSFKETLALEGLRAVERKLSPEELQSFKFRYANPQLEEAYEVWKGLKAACTRVNR